MAQEAKSFSMSQEEFSCFKGYPYLVVRIMTALYHINLMTAERSSLDWLCNIAQAQANANKFEVCLVLNAHVGVYFSSRHKPYSSEVIPRGGIAITDRLRLCVDQPSGEDFLRRGKDLEVFIENNSPKSGFLLGDLKKRRPGGHAGRADFSSGRPGKRTSKRDYDLSDLRRLPR